MMALSEQSSATAVVAPLANPGQATAPQQVAEEKMSGKNHHLSRAAMLQPILEIQFEQRFLKEAR